MSRRSKEIHEIEIFMDGIASVCDDVELIREKCIERYGNEYKQLIQRLLALRSEPFSAEKLAGFLDGHDAEDLFSDYKILCAKRNGLVIVSGYSDDLIELKGAVRKEADCFRGGRFHLLQEKGEWKLEEGQGSCNNISANWYDSARTNDFDEVIPWTYETDIPHALFSMSFRGDTFCEGFVFDIKDLKA